MPETEPKITYIGVIYKQIHRRIKNPAKHLKWSKKDYEYTWVPNMLGFIIK